MIGYLYIRKLETECSVNFKVARDSSQDIMVKTPQLDLISSFIRPLQILVVRATLHDENMITYFFMLN